MATVTERLITAEEYWQMPGPADGSKTELVRGEVVKLCRPGFQHGICQVRITVLLDQYGRTTGNGRTTVETGVVTERGPDTVRGPDVSYWSKDRLPLDQRPRGYPELAPDLCVEVLSPSNRKAVIWEKLREYFQREVRMAWIVDPEERTVTVYRSPEQGRIFHESAVLSGEDVLPGFQCRVEELFD